MADEEYSGKFVLRLPKTLHRQLSEKAKHEGVSLNQYTLYKLNK
ncbi:toxin-antitoxin system HicB family antitoxin [Marinicrinis sediminis]|uniref:Toxin-antitoxin system HicB family antitoxin n=1 Tax=Marinicrinis sediminis TaxID=1652465 RepID=A0ABW5R7Q0_9BACL